MGSGCDEGEGGVFKLIKRQRVCNSSLEPLNEGRPKV